MRARVGACPRPRVRFVREERALARARAWHRGRWYNRGMKLSPWRWWWCVWVVVAVVVAPLVAVGAEREGGAVVEKSQPTVTYKRYDPLNLPTPPPPLRKGESAVCVYQFVVATDVGCTYAVAANAPRGPVKLDVTLTRVTVKLGLNVTLWLPNDADQRLVAHEEGHRSIAEHYYETSDRAARAIAKRVAGTTVPAEGATRAEAVEAAIDRVNKQLCDDCMAAVSRPCERAETAFDRMTDHSRKESPTAREAIDLSIKEAEEKK